MAHDTIPPPSGFESHMGEMLIERAVSGEIDKAQAAAVVAQMHAEIRWLHGLIQRGMRNDRV